MESTNASPVDFHHGQGPSHRLTKHGLNLIMALFFLTGGPPSLAQVPCQVLSSPSSSSFEPFILYNDVTALLMGVL
jgi:hypothetical protein